MKKILVLGGTKFIGRNLVEKLIFLDKYDVTLFNRQKTDSTLFPELTLLKGDRETDEVSQFTNQYWDCVIDLSCFFPNSLEKLLNDLEGKIGRYIFISTLSVYELDKNLLEFNIKEDFQTLSCNESEKSDITMSTYGKRKAECERVLLKAKWLNKIILRPSIVYGKYDDTDRFYYWLYKAKKQKTIIIPGHVSDKITLTFVSDLIDIIIQSIEITNHSTLYNVPTHKPLTLSEIIKTIKMNINLVNINSETLIDNGLLPEKDIPLWFDSPLMLSDEKLKLDFKILNSFEESINQSIAYFSKLNWPEPKNNIDANKENDLIQSFC
jgi:2'-hydroxyisoflavone reductase